MAIGLRRSDLVNRRIQWLSVVVAIFYLALVGRLTYLQAFQGGYYRKKAAMMRSQRITLEAQRGAILDRDGRPLAATTQSATLVCDPTQVRDPRRTAAVAAGLLGVSPAEILPLVSPGRRLPNGKPNRAVVVRKGLTPEVEEAFRQARSARALARDLEGLAIDHRPERAYPTGRDSVHVVGFLAPDREGRFTGQMGLEQSLDDTLRGQDGYVKAEVDARRRIIPDTQVERRNAVHGNDVRLTLDSTIQHIAETELAAACAQFRPIGATAIVLDPKTGDILAMVNYPSFDPIKRTELRQDHEPLRNRALALFEPGSTLKAISVAIGLEEKILSPSATFYCKGRLTVGRRTIHCVLHGAKERYGHGVITLRSLIARSCNVSTAQLGMHLGLNRLQEGLESFGLLNQTGIGLPGDAAGTLGFGKEAVQGGQSKAARVAFGQSVMVSPLGLAAAYAAIANGGVLMRPRLVLAHQDAAGNTLRQFPPVPVRQVIRPEVAAHLRDYLAETVTSGTGRKTANVPGYTVAGKTGTAQKVVPGRRGYARDKHVASFIGFLPVKDPRAVICVVVDEPQGLYYGAQVAAPVFQAIARRLMWYWKVPPDDPASLPKPRIVQR